MRAQRNTEGKVDVKYYQMLFFNEKMIADSRKIELELEGGWPNSTQ
jgi:hypothetical protein